MQLSHQARPAENPLTEQIERDINGEMPLTEQIERDDIAATVSTDLLSWLLTGLTTEQIK